MTTLTAAQVAALHNCHPRTVKRSIARGDFPGAYRNMTSRTAEWLIPQSEAEAWTPPNQGWPKGKPRNT